jgi:hypothetical protein
MIVIVDMRGHSKIIPPRIHIVIYRELPAKHRKAEGQRKRKQLVRNIQPAKHLPQVSIICVKQSFGETISHMNDKRHDAAMYGRRLVRPRYFYEKQEHRLTVQTSSD